MTPGGQIAIPLDKAAIREPQSNKSVKATVVSWITTNGVNFGLADKDGMLSGSAVEEIAKVVNWDTKGGANPTGGPVEPDSEPNLEPVENFRRADAEKLLDNDDSEVPF
ncbi:hypothetical protein [Sedimentitalea sp.]|uniref:hypothetical protein n=1 Tax=Sedimentitalea sp. TaxID=2048915 RepID=UPI0032971BB5